MSLPSRDRIAEICRVFHELFPQREYGELASRISAYWTDMIKRVWHGKPERIRQKDLEKQGLQPLYRIRQKTMVIAYPDSVYQADENSLQALDRFLKNRFPSIDGIHVLPACLTAEGRFNDGFFSQIERTRIHPRFGTNREFEDLMESRVSMADFVLNHVDIENPVFQTYLAGDDAAGDCFYVFSESEYRKRLARGDFDNIFRPRPFPLFTIFRRQPSEPDFHGLAMDDKIRAAAGLLPPILQNPPLIGILSVFNKVKNDQMLLDEDFSRVTDFREYLAQKGMDPDSVFTLSRIQETGHPPYIFKASISGRADLMQAIGYDKETALYVRDVYEKIDRQIFGEEIRALTTFSHVQVDVNTSTLAGLKMLADDFSWYLGMDLNLLRLDAAHYAFKKWKTTCFGLPEVRALLRILNLSMEAVSPRMAANLEVNDRLGYVLCQLADPSCQAPVMYDFHLAAVLPAVFITADTQILERVFDLIKEYQVPRERIRFSIIESHDGKSIPGSMDILTVSERLEVIDTVMANGGHVKYRSVARRKIEKKELDQFCRAAGLDPAEVSKNLFMRDNASPEVLYLKQQFRQPTDIARQLGLFPEEMQKSKALTLLTERLIHGREPYEMCTSTWDSMPKLSDRHLASARFLSFYTLGFALAGRNVKSIYFNDLIALPNDLNRIRQTGELRDIKRTRIKPASYEQQELTGKIKNRQSVQGIIARGINELIGIIDNDPALAPEGDEAELFASKNPSVAAVRNRCGKHYTITVVNVSKQERLAEIDVKDTKHKEEKIFKDLITGRTVNTRPAGKLRLRLKPFERLWLKPADTA